MSYTVETINSCTKKIAFNFDSLDLTTEIKSALVQKQKSSNLKGFRKGKAPLAVIEKLYGRQVETEALNQFIQNEFLKAISEENLRVVGYPSFENMNYDNGKSVSFDAKVEIFPEFELKGVEGHAFTKDKVDVSDDDVEEVKKNYLNSKAELKEIEDTEKALEEGLFAVLNFQGTTESGEKPESMKGEEFLLEIGSGQFIPGFEEGMIGMKPGDKKDIDVTFPEDYHAEDFRGAKVTFSVELLEIKQKNLPEFTDELAKEFGYDSVEAFFTKNKETLVQQKKRQADEKLHQEILEKLVDGNEFEIPLAMIAQQEEQVKKDVEQSLKQQGFNEEMMKQYFEKWSEDIRSKAVFQVRSGLILEQLARKYSIEATESDFDSKIEEMATQSGLEVDKVKSYYTSNDKIKRNIMYAIREEKTFEKLKESLTIN